MTTVFINNFNGGYTDDVRTFTTNESESSLNFDILHKPHLLQPYPDSVTETVTAGTITDHKMSDVIDTVALSSDGYIGLGQAGASDANLKFFSTSSPGSAWTKRVEQSAGIGLSGTLVGYKTYAYALEQSGSNINLVQLTNASTITDKGTISSVSGACRPFVHPEDNLLYIGTDNVLSRFDGTNDVDSGTGDSDIFTTLLPADYSITSLTNYGTYLVIGGTNGAGDAIAYLWGRDGTLNTLQGVINFGRANAFIITNIGDVLVGVTLQARATNINDKIFVKSWAGGEVATIKEVDITFSGNVGITYYQSGDKLFFVPGVDNCIWVLGKNKEGRWVISKDRYTFNGVTPALIRGISVLDDKVWVGFTDSNGDSQFYLSSDAYTSTSIYKTTINPAMPIVDRYIDKQLKAVQIAVTGASSGNIVVKYSVDGSSMTTIISDANSTGEYVVETTNEHTNALQLLSGREFQFQIESTGGAKIKELRYRYEKLNQTV